MKIFLIFRSLKESTYLETVEEQSNVDQIVRLIDSLNKLKLRRFPRNLLDEALSALTYGLIDLSNDQFLKTFHLSISM